MFVSGHWVDHTDQQEVRHPFDNVTVDVVPRATNEHVEAALVGGVSGAREMRKLTGYDRYHILRRAAQLLAERKEQFARTISMEEGKILAEGRLEVDRAVDTLELSAAEARCIHGQGLPLDGAPGGAGKLGFTLRVPCGLVVAITPFNFPLNLVCHKVGPALAAGNAVILKPATDTPLSALMLVQVLLDAGLPPLALSCLTGSGVQVGEALCRDARVRKISFTGSAEVGRRICEVAGLKRVTMELGSNSPVIVLADADPTVVAAAIAKAGFANAGQLCISAQRIIALPPVHDAIVDSLRDRVSQLRAGDPMAEDTDVGPLVRERDAVRVANWIQEAVAGGARLICGGHREGALLQPAVLSDVQPDMRISRDELFGPAVAVLRATDPQHAIDLANDTRYGLSAAVFTRDLDAALRFAREVDSGNIHINGGPAWRADLMPYGGLKESGMGKEGPHYAVLEMTEEKSVVIHGSE